MKRTTILTVLTLLAITMPLISTGCYKMRSVEYKGPNNEIEISTIIPAFEDKLNDNEIEVGDRRKTRIIILGYKNRPGGYIGNHSTSLILISAWYNDHGELVRDWHHTLYPGEHVFHNHILTGRKIKVLFLEKEMEFYVPPKLERD